MFKFNCSVCVVLIANVKTVSFVYITTNTPLAVRLVGSNLRIGDVGVRLGAPTTENNKRNSVQAKCFVNIISGGDIGSTLVPI